MAKVLSGKVVSNKGDKTIVISVVTKMTHPIYRKSYHETKKFMAHDEANSAEVGDIVRIREVRPISKRKNWVLDAIVETASISSKDTVEKVLDVSSEEDQQ